MAEDIDVDPKTFRNLPKITTSQKPDVFTTDGHHYFINGVMRVEGFPHITPMSEEETENFFADYQHMTRDELHAKWGRFSVQSNEVIDLTIRGE